MKGRHPDFVPPKLEPEMSVADLCAEVGILPMVTPGEAILPESLRHEPNSAVGAYDI
jgi:hypothetical protein